MSTLTLISASPVDPELPAFLARLLELDDVEQPLPPPNTCSVVVALIKYTERS